MTPPKRKQANIKQILKNPIQSKQPPLKFKKEGFWGWLSYIGFSLLVIVPLAKLVANLISFYTAVDGSAFIKFPFYERGIFIPSIILIGFILTLVIMKKSPYHFSKLITNFFVAILFALFIFEVYFFNDQTVDILILFVSFSTTWLAFTVWYIHFFIKKSKDGYRWVWLKVLLFSLIPVIPLFFYAKGFIFHSTEMGTEMGSYGDYLTDPADYGYDLAEPTIETKK
ncbi:MAG: hypothetical protein SPL08_02400 [Pseudomonadota bacterium]|nr:hypothetical protein [Pseudomonadota bacterium]